MIWVGEDPGMLTHTKKRKSPLSDVVGLFFCEGAAQQSTRQGACEAEETVAQSDSSLPQTVPT